MLIDFVNICVSDGATILPTIFRSESFGISSRPAAFLSFHSVNSLLTTCTVGALRENVVLVGSRTQAVH